MEDTHLANDLLVSIVIASYRRLEMLRDTVISLCDLQQPEGVSVEVLIVDNDPEAEAKEVADRLRSECSEHFTVDYFHETNQGLSFARNRGIEESNGDMIVFFDDDMFIEPSWLAAVLECFERTGAACVGGRTLIHWESEPDEVLRQCESKVVALDLGDDDFRMQGCKTPGGGNAAFRRSVFASGYRFSTKLGRVGTVLLSGEDTELFERMRKDGQAIWYCAKATVRHRTGGERLKQGYIVRQKYWFGISAAIMDRRLNGRLYQVIHAFARGLKASVYYAPLWLLAACSRNGSRMFLSKCYLAKQCGYIQATVGAAGVCSASREHETG